MASEHGDIPKFTGLSKYFNSYTLQGRANIVTAVWGGLAAIALYYKFIKPSKKQ